MTMCAGTLASPSGQDEYRDAQLEYCKAGNDDVRRYACECKQAR